MGADLEFQPLESGGADLGAPAAGDLSPLAAVPVELAVEIGRTRMTIAETLALTPGSIITLERLAGEPVDLLVNGRAIARGEVVVIGEEFGFRVTQVLGGATPGPAPFEPPAA